MTHPAAEPLLDQAGRHLNTGDFSTASTLVNQALSLEPNNVRALCFAAIVAVETHQKPAALASIQRALQLAPNTPAVLNNAACIFIQCGQTTRAMELWRRLATANPPSADALYNLGLCHLQLAEPDLAQAAFRQVIQLAPHHRDVYINLGNLLKSAGQIDQAIALFRQGLTQHPHDLRAHSNLLYALHFTPASTPQDILQHAAAWGRAFESAIPPCPRHDNDPSPNRPLRIGYLSPNFRDHSETYFVLPLLKAIDRSQYQTYIYSDNLADDQVTALLRPHADSWRNVATTNTQKLADTIRHDRIDVLVDLTMHMQSGRLELFARKPAPVQLTWLAYPSTTGLSRIDYTLLDPYLDTHNPQDFTESPYILPQSYWCYEPYGPRPPVTPSPAATGQAVTFGCLNHFGKITPDTLQAWAQILRRVENSRLILHVESSSAAAVAAFLAAQGLQPHQLLCQPRQPRQAYLETYHRMDIALDPFPYNGATTTCDALWMGVPVISRSGPTPVSRAGLSLLSNLGLPDLVASTWDQYIALADALAHDLPRLKHLRQTLRQQMEHSPLMNPQSFATAMSQAYRTTWQHWCTHIKPNI